jgi:tRNA wybutosine-synthesizing protein 3
MPSARWGHSLTAFGTRSALLFGGRNAVHVLRDSFILTLNDDGVGQWSLVDSGNGPTPPSRFFHAACSVAENVLIHGGLAAIESTNAFADLWLFTTHRAWERVSLTSTLPFFAHSISHVGARSLLIFGGVSFQQAEGAESLLSPVILIDLISVFDGQGWSTRGLRRDAEMAVLPDDAALVMHHQAVVTETGVLIVGGGCSCLGLGPAFAPSLTLQLHTPHTTQGQVYTPVEPTDADEHGMSEVSDTHLQAVLLCAAAHVKRLKVLLESYAWLDKQKRITSADADAIDTVQEIDTVKRVWGGVYDSLRASPLRDEVTLKALPLCRNASEALRRLDREMLETLAEAGFLRLFMSSQSTPTSKVLHISPSLRAHTLLSQLRAEHGIPDRDGKDLPRHFELIGDVLMIPEDALLGPWDALGSSLWAEIAKCFGVQRVARKARIAPTGTRDSCITLLWPQQSHEEMGPGSAGWVQIRENGVLFAFDITKVMFCSGNNTERMRMGALHAQGETVADLYCGIGYYTLPLLVHAGAHFVHAFEWNPHSLLALRHNLEANGVSSRCKIYEGDNREQAPTIGRIAHRILLGLLPSSKDGWPLAVRLLREEGGWIHVHGNTLDEERDVWVRDVLNEFEALAEAQQRRWMIECVHVERVKSYAPYVGHYVVDLRCDAFVVEGKADAH